MSSIRSMLLQKALKTATNGVMFIESEVVPASSNNIKKVINLSDTSLNKNIVMRGMAKKELDNPATPVLVKSSLSTIKVGVLGQNTLVQFSSKGEKDHGNTKRRFENHTGATGEATGISLSFSNTLMNRYSKKTLAQISDLGCCSFLKSLKKQDPDDLLLFADLTNIPPDFYHRQNYSELASRSVLICDPADGTPIPVSDSYRDEDETTIHDLAVQNIVCTVNRTESGQLKVSMNPLYISPKDKTKLSAGIQELCDKVANDFHYAAIKHRDGHSVPGTQVTFDSYTEKLKEVFEHHFKAQLASDELTLPEKDLAQLFLNLIVKNYEEPDIQLSLPAPAMKK